jgi:uncharacterized protein YqjF (DUF2071 family)
MKKTFLQAEWRKLAMANFSVDKEILKKYLPHKTEIDIWQNTCYVSLVGFMFLNTKLKGFRIPFHSNFEEVNLRFYVRYKENKEWKRGVVFIKEIVPKPALTFVANRVYRERYETMKMKHTWLTGHDFLNVEYHWKKDEWNSFKISAHSGETDIQDGSQEEFITEHFWGYTFVNKNKTSEYGVEHPRWKIYPVTAYSIDVDFGNIYGHDFRFLLNEKPKSVFLAEGSEILVREGVYI